MRPCGPALFSLICLAAGCAASLQHPAARSSDLILEASPFKSEQIRQGSISDAAQDIADLKGLRENVYFRIEKVVEGKLAPREVKPASRWDQLKDSAGNKEIDKLLTLDYETQPVKVERQHFRVAVRDASEVFGFSRFEEKMPVYRLYLRRYENQKDTYVLVASEKI